MTVLVGDVWHDSDYLFTGMYLGQDKRIRQGCKYTPGGLDIRGTGGTTQARMVNQTKVSILLILNEVLT